jgi:hypothetical protein
MEQPSSGRGAGGAPKPIGAAVAEEPARRGGQGNHPDRQLAPGGKDRGGDHHRLAGRDRQDGVERAGAKDRQIGQREACTWVSQSNTPLLPRAPVWGGSSGRQD